METAHLICCRGMRPISGGIHVRYKCFFNIYFRSLFTIIQNSIILLLKYCGGMKKTHKTHPFDTIHFIFSFNFAKASLYPLGTIFCKIPFERFPRTVIIGYHFRRVPGRNEYQDAPSVVRPGFAIFHHRRGGFRGSSHGGAAPVAADAH